MISRICMSVLMLLGVCGVATAATDEQAAKVFERLRGRNSSGTMTLSFQFLAGVVNHARNAHYLADADKMGWGTEHREVAAFLERFSYSDARASVAVVQIGFHTVPKVCYKEAFDTTSGLSCLDWPPTRVAAMALFFESIRSNTERFKSAYTQATSLSEKYQLMIAVSPDKNFVHPSAVSETKAAFIEEALKPGALEVMKANDPQRHKDAVSWLRSADAAAYRAIGQIKNGQKSDQIIFLIDENVFQINPRQIQDVLKTVPTKSAQLGEGVKWFIDATRSTQGVTASHEVLKSARDQIIEAPRLQKP